MKNISSFIKGVKPLEQVKSGEYRKGTKGKPSAPNTLTFEITGGKSSMPRGAWWGPLRYLRDDYPDFLTDEFYGYMHEAGLNFICAIPNNIGSHKEVVLESLDMSFKHNIGVFINDYSFRAADEEAMKEHLPLYIEHPACLGVHVQDEPYPEEFANLANVKEIYERLTTVNKPLYYNFFPSYGKFGEDDVRLRNYEKYLADACDTVGVQMLSYDYYAFKKSECEWGRLKLYFDNLSLAKSVSQKRNIPFWTFVQTGDAYYDAAVSSKERDFYPTRGMLLWNVNTNLAYGSKAIQYFTFIQPSCRGGLKDMQCNRLGMIGADGKKTEWFDYVKEANARIKDVESYLMNAENQGIMISGERTKTLITGNEVLSSYREVQAVGGDEMVVGCFNYDGRTLLYAVNNDYDKDGVLRVSLDDSYAMEIVLQGQSYACVGKDIEIRLSEGEGVLIRIL